MPRKHEGGNTMGFAEDVKALAERFSTMGNNILNDEATKI